MTGRRPWLLLAIVLALAPLVAWGAFAVPPKPSNGVHDGADLLTATQEKELAAKLAAFRDGTGPEIGVAIVPSLEGHDLSQTRYEIFNAWKIGDAERNDGALLLVVADKARAMTPGAASCGCAGIEVGRYLEGDLTDTQSKQVLRDAFIGPASRGDFYEAVDGATDGIMAAVGGDSEAARRHRTESDSGGDEGGGGFPWWGWLVVIVVAVVLQALGVPIIDIILVILSAGGGRGGGSGGGGSGGGFGGGGSSGGGGANI